jgi:hypothetical protein
MIRPSRFTTFIVVIVFFLMMLGYHLANGLRSVVDFICGDINDSIYSPYNRYGLYQRHHQSWQEEQNKSREAWRKLTKMVEDAKKLDRKEV